MAEVEVLVPNMDKKLKPGMYASVTVTTGILDNVIVVPRFAVIENTSLVNNNGKDKVIKNYFVYVASDSSKAEQRKLKVDYVNHVNLAVSEGLAVGEKLVVSGQNNLRDGIGVLLTDQEETE
jgi:multidrug efflux pump subunit AcrA (membrane-fusion protein)